MSDKASKDHEENGNYPLLGLHTSQFREAAHRLVDIIIDYHDSLKNGRLPVPDVEPGFMRSRVPELPPQTKETWQDVFKDIHRVILDGNMHWLAGGNFGYFPTGISYPSLLGDLLCGSSAAIGFTWASSPACTELETIMLDWVARTLDLPDCFIHGGKGPGGGVIQSSASDATLVTLLAARSKELYGGKYQCSEKTSHETVQRMVAYSSKCSHSSVERAGKVAMIEMRLLDVDENASLRGHVLQRAIDEDRKAGKIPVYVCATVGTTACCSYDNLVEIGEICEKERIWLHVDAAYAGSALLCPEYRWIATGLEKVTSFNFNAHKWMMINFDCSPLWVRSTSDVMSMFNVNPTYLQHKNQSKTIDYRHWQIPLGRRFRSIKLWFVMRMIGLEGLRHHIREGVNRAKRFEKLVRADERFEILFPTMPLGLVCFRVSIPSTTLEVLNEINRRVHAKMENDNQYLITASTVKEVFFLRVSTGMNFCNDDLLKKGWLWIQEKTSEVLQCYKSNS